MTLPESSQIVEMYDAAVKSGKYLEWDLPTLLGIQTQLREARVLRIQAAYPVEPCEAVLEKINRAIEMRQLEAQSERQHKENRKLNWWVFWIAAASLIVGIVGVCQQQANRQTSTPAPSTNGILPATSPLPQIAQLSPTPEPSLEPTATATPEPEPTAQPSQSPQLSPTPER